MRIKQLFLTLALLCAIVQGAWAQNGIYCTASDKGRVVCTDGSIYDNVSAAEADGKTAVAMIAYLDTENNKGLALALADESDWMAWSTAISTCSAKTPTVTGGTWKLATKDEWVLMISAAGSYNALHDGFSSVGGTNMQWSSTYYYWSSTEYDSGHAWNYNFSGGSWYSDLKENCNYVRACLAFDFNAPVTKMADNWYMISRQTQTRQSDWTALSAGSTTGRTLGSADAVTYYYATGDLSFTNSTVGGSGLTIQGTVYLYIPSGTTLTCTGANASGQTGAGAGIELTQGNSLYLIGGGTLNANGGNAANGETGGTGGNATGGNGSWTQTGAGGNGGNGGGGAGAGIGTRGGAGGSGGAGGGGNYYNDGKEDDAFGGTNGTSGSAGATAGAMGALYVSNAITVSATGGHAGSSGGSGGQRGRGYAYDGSSYNVTVAGGGGGGGGGFGGAASNIGTGGPGGGGGGGGAGGAQDWRPNSKGGVYDVTAPGGHGGQNANGGYAGDGTEAGTNGTAQSQGWVTVENGSFDSDDWNPASGDAPAGTAGNGSTAGSASVGGSYGTVTVDWTTQGKGTEDAPFIVSSTDDWNVFADYVNSGYAFSGEFVKLGDDISVSIPAGIRKSDSYNGPFSGTFLGDGHTITVTLTDDGKQGLAPFRSIDGATIKYLKVAGTIASSQYHSAGIAGFASGTNTIEDCLVTATLNISSDYAGGIIGHGQTSATTIRGCAFTGTVNGVDGNRSNIGGLWGWSDNATPALVNCLEAGTYTNIASMHPMGLQKAAGNITNCYYTTPQIGSPENACTVSGAKQAVATATAPANLGDAVEDYGMVKAYQNGILVGGTYYVVPATVTLADNADNSTTISDKDGYVADVTLAGRTFYRDGAWNTLCLPFSMALSGSVLDGDNVDVRTLSSSSFSNGTLTLNFTPATGDGAVTELQAGTPYIIKWSKSNESDPDLTNLVNPVFTGVTVSNAMHDAETSNVTFKGTYSPVGIYTDEKTNLYLGADNTLYYPTASNFKVNAFRGYFQLNGLTAGDPNAGVRAFVLNFGDDDNATGIVSAEANSSLFTLHSSLSEWYSLDGCRLNGKPSRAGVYINDGKKVVIK